MDNCVCAAFCGCFPKVLLRWPPFAPKGAQQPGAPLLCFVQQRFPVACRVFREIVHLCPLRDNKSQWRRQQQEPQQHPDLSFRYPCVGFRHQTYRYRHQASDLTTSIAMFRTRESWFEVKICRCAANHSENNYKCDYATASTTHLLRAWRHFKFCRFCLKRVACAKC